MSDSVHTGGGAYVGSEVHTDGGTFIGRDQIIVLSGYTSEQLELVLARLREMLAGGNADLCADIGRRRLTVTAPDAPEIVLSEQAAYDLLPAAARQANERAYLTALLVNPRYGRWARQFVPLAGTLSTTELPPGWSDVAPEFTELQISGEGPGRQVRRVRLEDITEALARHDALALLGEPGAGKTTTLYKLARDAAQQRLTRGHGPLPLPVALADYRGYPSPHAFLQATWTQYLGHGEITEWLRRGEVCLLCDALNEMPFENDRDYRDKVGAWRRFAREWPHNRLIFTCRSRDYSEPLGLPQVEIERLDDQRVREFLDKYLAPAAAADAWSHLSNNPLLALVRNPYYLSMLCLSLAGDGGDWPANRGQLLDSFVLYLLRREANRGHPDWPGLEAVRTALAALAASIQPLGEGTRLPRRELLARIPAEVDGPDGPVATPPLVVLRLGLAATLLDVERTADQGETVRFYHQQLQEHFAARALLARFRAGEDLTPQWRAPRLAGDMPATGPLSDYEPLPPPPATGWEEPTILAAGLAPNPALFLEAIRRANPVLAARCLAESGIAPLPDLIATVRRDLLAEMGDRRVHLRARLAAGDVLGRLGDPRFRVVEVDGHRVLLPPLIPIPAGPVMLGSRRWQVWWLTRRGFPAEDELPRHPAQVAEFAIGQFPVTNAEYACFMAAGGYHQEQWWRTAAARAWLRGEITDGGAVGEIMGLWRALRADPKQLQQLKQAGWSPQAVTTWERLIQMEEAEVQGLVSKQYTDRPHDRPAFRADERYSGPAQPVVGINWYEANAYCDWLAEQMRHVPGTSQVPGTSSASVRLPTEAEWERAARMGRGWVYPWGNRWDAGRANTWEGHVLRSNPVGVYPAGATPEGVHDLSGNVWEWTASLYQPYPYRAEDGRNEPEAEGPRVVRGGSWHDVQRGARCAVRYWDGPVNFSTYFGFRVVASL
jgi:formylglycine-generating enzyme required for sulfatase activity